MPPEVYFLHGAYCTREQLLISYYVQFPTERSFVHNSPDHEPKGDPFNYFLEPLLEGDRKQCDAWKDEVQNILIFVWSNLKSEDPDY